MTQNNILLSVELIKRLVAEIEERQAQIEALKDELKDAMNAQGCQQAQCWHLQSQLHRR